MHRSTCLWSVGEGSAGTSRPVIPASSPGFWSVVSITKPCMPPWVFPSANPRSPSTGTGADLFSASSLSLKETETADGCSSDRISLFGRLRTGIGRGSLFCIVGLKDTDGEDEALGEGPGRAED